MKPEHDIVLIVVAYNRVKTLERLLASIQKSVYPDGFNIGLVISIDKGENESVVNFAKRFEWNYGPKELILHPKNLGVKNHVIACGDLTEKYENVVILEDDTYVSPYFFKYAESAISYYKNQKEIAGISIYTQPNNFNVQRPFSPNYDQADVFFLQIPASSGQVWTGSMWSEFKLFYQNNKDIPKGLLPKNMENWPSSSWVKHYAHYMVSTNKFFVYPRVSYSTNFGDLGTHSSYKTFVHQTRLQLSDKNITFVSLEESMAVYDVFFEILPRILVHYNTELQKYSFDVDLYGNKQPSHTEKKYILTSKQSDSTIKSYGLELKPQELNIFENIPGRYFHLLENNNHEKNKSSINLTEFNYFYGDLSLIELVRLALSKILGKIKR